MINYLLNLLRPVRDHGGIEPLIKRSGQWPRVRAVHLQKEPYCQCCGHAKDLNVHHIEPVHEHPELELVDSNLITLCQGPGGGCHLLVGHLKLWSSKNVHVRDWCQMILPAVRNRPVIKSVFEVVGPQESVLE